MDAVGPPATAGSVAGEWVLLSYRLPREPSTPRIAVWRRVRRLGVAQLGDGVVALPADARTREALEWVAQEVTDASGTAMVWLARPASSTDERTLAATLAAARASEYRTVTEQAAAGRDLAGPERARLIRRLRGELRSIERRDFFPPAERDEARQAMAELASGAAHPRVAADSSRGRR